MDAWFADGTGARLLEEEIFGTGDGARIAVIVDAFCAGSLGSPVERYEFFASSVLSVHGVRLADGRRVVIKAARREFGFEFLAATQTVVQSHLADHGFARPRPLGGPRPLVNGIVVAEELVERGSHANAHQPTVRRAMAGGWLALPARPSRRPGHSRPSCDPDPCAGRSLTQEIRCCCVATS